MKIWGLTGGIGAGKSTVAEWFKRQGIPVLDADHMAREVLTPEMVRTHFGREFAPAEQIDRVKLATYVFEHPAERLRLEDLTHPLIAERLMVELQALQGSPLVIYEAALIFEKGLEGRFEGVIWVTAPVSVRLERLRMKGISPEDARRRMKAQMSDSEAMQRASYLVDNSGDFGDLNRQLSVIRDKLLQPLD